MLLTARISSYGCSWEVWRVLKMLYLLSAAPRATLTHFSCSPNFPRASITRYTQAKHEQILNFPNQISPVSLFEYVLNRQIYVWEKPSDKRKKQNKKKPIFFQRTFLNDEKTMNPRHSQHNVFFLLSEHSQVLTFFVPGFALLYAITMGFYILTWKFGKRKPGVKGFLESLST